jgi:N-acyl-D-amino-acid deacylase
VKASFFHNSAALVLLVLALGSLLQGQPLLSAQQYLSAHAAAPVHDLLITNARVVDARGQIVAPGFIDVHTHVESIYNLPAAENFVRMGVTSLVTGNCGSSSTEVGQFLGRITEKPLAVNLATLIAHGSVRRKVMGLGDRAPIADASAAN